MVWWWTGEIFFTFNATFSGRLFFSLVTNARPSEKARRKPTKFGVVAIEKKKSWMKKGRNEI